MRMCSESAFKQGVGTRIFTRRVHVTVSIFVVWPPRSGRNERGRPFDKAPTPAFRELLSHLDLNRRTQRKQRGQFKESLLPLRPSVQNQIGRLFCGVAPVSSLWTQRGQRSRHFRGAVSQKADTLFLRCQRCRALLKPEFDTLPPTFQPNKDGLTNGLATGGFLGERLGGTRMSVLRREA